MQHKACNATQHNALHTKATVFFKYCLQHTWHSINKSLPVFWRSYMFTALFYITLQHSFSAWLQCAAAALWCSVDSAQCSVMIVCCVLCCVFYCLMTLQLNLEGEYIQQAGTLSSCTLLVISMQLQSFFDINSLQEIGFVLYFSLVSYFSYFEWEAPTLLWDGCILSSAIAGNSVSRAASCLPDWWLALRLSLPCIFVFVVHFCICSVFLWLWCIFVFL